MPKKVNPYAQRPVSRQTQTRDFTDPNAPDDTITLTLSVAPDAGLDLAIQQATFEYVRDYLGSGSDAPTKSLMPVWGRVPTLCQMTCGYYAGLEMRQVIADGDEGYTFMDFAALSLTMPSAVTAMTVWIDEIRRGQGGGEQEKNSSGAVTGTTSELPSTSEPDTTPKS